MKFDQAAFEGTTPQCAGKVVYQRQVESTNDVAKKAVNAGLASSGSIYLAEFQSAGRGRGGNRWVCPEGEGLLFSLVVEPDVDVLFWNRMSLAVGLALVNTIKDFGLNVTMKWPNDIYLGDKKLGGILIEKVNDFLIVGVGLNVNVQSFPDEIAETATSISTRIGEVVDREELLSKIVHRIYQCGSMIGESFGSLIEQVMESFYLSNQMVRMTVDGKEILGEVLGLDENGYLMLKETGNDGKLMKIHQASEIKKLSLS